MPDQPEWINLGAAIPATNATVSVSDTIGQISSVFTAW